jgi:hypothetical protein
MTGGTHLCLCTATIQTNIGRDIERFAYVFKTCVKSMVAIRTSRETGSIPRLTFYITSSASTPTKRRHSTLSYFSSVEFENRLDLPNTVSDKPVAGQLMVVFGEIRLVNAAY